MPEIEALLQKSKEITAKRAQLKFVHSLRVDVDTLKAMYTRAQGLGMDPSTWQHGVLIYSNLVYAMEIVKRFEGMDWIPRESQIPLHNSERNMLHEFATFIGHHDHEWEPAICQYMMNYGNQK